MNAVKKIKAAAAKLGPKEQVVKLKRQVAIGVEDLEQGRYQTYNDGDLIRLVEDVCNRGRTKLRA